MALNSMTITSHRIVESLRSITESGGKWIMHELVNESKGLISSFNFITSLICD